MTEKDKLIRKFEKTAYYGYIFSVKYTGSFFDSFDENPGLRSVKGEFRKLIEQSGITIFKGVQQAGRTDRDVSADENRLYFNSKNFITVESLKNMESEGLEILGMERTLPFLEFPMMIARRHYVYCLPERLIRKSEEEITAKCHELSGKKDYIKFTSRKGEMLKNHVRDIRVEYENGKLYFQGGGFLPQQVRIMSSVILTGNIKPLPGKYLTFLKVDYSEEMRKLIFKEEVLDEIDEILESIVKIEKNSYFTVFYVKSENKGRIIGKKGKNIKKLKKVYGDIVVKEIED